MNLLLPGFDAPQAYEPRKIELAFGLDYTLPSGTYSIPVPAGFEVYEVQTVVTTAFDGSPTLKIGDGDDDDGYLTSANIAPGTAATVTVPAIKSSRILTNPFQAGKRYAVADTVDLVWVAGTNPTAGVLKGTVTLVPLPDLGLQASATAI